MNHAAIMTVFKMELMNFMVRSNFLKIATKNKWFFPNQAINVQFYRPLKMHKKAIFIHNRHHQTLNKSGN